MKIIDFHQHLWVSGTRSIRAVGAEGMVRGMDEHNVERAVVHALPTSLYAHCGDNEDVLKAIRQFPDRLIGSMYVNPKDVTRTLETLERYHGEGFRCVKILPYVEGIYVDSPEYTPVFEKIDAPGPARHAAHGPARGHAAHRSENARGLQVHSSHVPEQPLLAVP